MVGDGNEGFATHDICGSKWSDEGMALQLLQLLRFVHVERAHEYDPMASKSKRASEY